MNGKSVKSCATPLAGLTPASVICEIMKDDGTMARLPDLMEFAAAHKLKIGTIADLIEYRSQTEKLVECVAERKVQTAYGELELRTYVDKTTHRTHLALIKGSIQPGVETLVRVHEPLSVLDFLEQVSYPNSTSVHDALRKIQQAPAGVLVLLHHNETSEDLLARATAKPETHSAARWDPRSYGIGAQILRDLNVGRMRLMAKPRKMPSMTGYDLEVTGHIEAPKRQAS